ncbi:unnamed protein product [Didymodactylos carnosus]|uniref:Uncharacterized protein n=1 Tax=Didymodactylos carnosus TaxID=1234261 RepID=A0A8S2VHU7_9BILA|nr:unnamed protein product [Didymodactylos carnosus]
MEINLKRCNSLSSSLCIQVNDRLRRLMIFQIPFESSARSVSFNGTVQFQRVENWITVVQIEPLAKLIDCFAYDQQQRVIWLAVTPQKQALFEITIDF